MRPYGTVEYRCTECGEAYEKPPSNECWSCESKTFDVSYVL